MHIVVDATALRDARLAWQSAMFARYAFHSPNDMPEQPGSKKRPEGVNSQADVAYVKAWMKAMHNQSRGRNGR